MRIECRQTGKVRGCCDGCGVWPELLHLPEKVHGWYCGRCCPVCGQRPMQGGTVGRLKAAPEMDFDHPEARVRD